jgi:hypothetical protein
LENLNVSEQKAEPTSGEPGSLNAPAVPTSPELQGKPEAGSAQESMQEPMKESASVDSPKLVPEQGSAGEPAKADAPKADVPKLDAVKPDAAKAEAPRIPGKLIMLSGDPGWDRNDAAPEPEAKPGSAMFGKRRVSALAAVVALAAVAGALGGALATAGFGHLAGNETQTASNRALEEQVAQLDADLAVVKASIEHTSKVGMTQFNKTSERLDKVEKAELEPAAKLAKLSEAVDKLRVAPVAPAVVAATPVAAAAKEVTGSISPPAAAPAPKVELARLPTVEGWVLRDVANGGALIEGRQGIYEVFAGDPVPGLGRVDAIRRQDGRWVVVTSKGLILAR